MCSLASSAMQPTTSALMLLSLPGMSSRPVELSLLDSDTAALRDAAANRVNQPTGQSMGQSQSLFCNLDVRNESSVAGIGPEIFYVPVGRWMGGRSQSRYNPSSVSSVEPRRHASPRAHTSSSTRKDKSSSRFQIEKNIVVNKSIKAAVLMSRLGRRIGTPLLPASRLIASECIRPLTWYMRVEMLSFSPWGALWCSCLSAELHRRSSRFGDATRTLACRFHHGNAFQYSSRYSRSNLSYRVRCYLTR